jgi:transposase
MRSEKALAAKHNPGPKSKLGPGQQRHLIQVLLRGAGVAGLQINLWPCGRMILVSERRFGVQHHRCDDWHPSRQLRFSAKKPKRRARERHDTAIEHLRNAEWRQINKERREAS